LTDRVSGKLPADLRVLQRGRGVGSSRNRVRRSPAQLVSDPRGLICGSAQRALKIDVLQILPSLRGLAQSERGLDRFIDQISGCPRGAR